MILWNNKLDHSNRIIKITNITEDKCPQITKILSLEQIKSISIGKD
jgi:hypothetical protein